jgi:hypothetical protein
MPEEILKHIVRNTGSPDFLRKGRAYALYNNILLFSNAIKEGYRGDAEAFRGYGQGDPRSANKAKAEWIWKKTLYAMMPKLLMKAGVMGLLGTGVKAVLDGASEYDKANYHIIPLGLTPQGKSVYMRVPIDETGRMMGGTIWKMLSIGDDKAITDLMDYMAGQAPTLNPAFGNIADIAAYSMDINPHDPFKDRRAVPDAIFEVGGKRSHIEFLKYIYGKSGGNIVYKFKYDDVDKIKTELEEILGYPITSNIVGRFIKVTDQGIREDVQKDIADIRQMKAKLTLDAKDAAYKMIRGDKLTNEDWLAMARKPGALDRNMLIAISKKTGAMWAEAMLRAQGDEEKIAIFNQFMKREKLLKKVGDKWRL